MKWTKVTPETLPPDGKRVMVTVRDKRDGRKYVWLDMYVCGPERKWMNWSVEMPDRYEVTHLAPMPAPAEDDEDLVMFEKAPWMGAPPSPPSIPVKRGRWRWMRTAL